MPLKFNQFSFDSSSASQDQPPFGAPTGHFGDQTDNIQREALSATNGLGQAIIGTSLNSTPHTPGTLPQLQSSSDNPAGDVNQLSSQFAQMVYDLTHPIGHTVLWTDPTGTGGIAAFTAAFVPAGVSAVWQVCDGTGFAPDVRNQVTAGADPDNPTTPIKSGEVIAAEKTSIEVTGLTVDDHALSVAQMPNHPHGFAGNPLPAQTYTARLPGGLNFFGTGGGQGTTPGGGSQFSLQPTATTDAKSAGTPTGSISATGSSQAHPHGVTDPGHDHDAGLPERVALEYYCRTA